MVVVVEMVVLAEVAVVEVVFTPVVVVEPVVVEEVVVDAGDIVVDVGKAVVVVETVVVVGDKHCDGKNGIHKLPAFEHPFEQTKNSHLQVPGIVVVELKIVVVGWQSHIPLEHMPVLMP